MPKKKEVEYVESLLKKERSMMFESPGFLSSGSTLLNLACTGTVDGAWPIGAYSLFIGDSSSGKTWVGLSSLAEASIDSRFDSYRLIYDGGEFGAMMSIQDYFGKKLAERIEPPAYEDGIPVASRTVEEMYVRIDDALEDSRPFIWIEDSMDCLSSLAEIGKFKDVRDAVKKDREVSGSYGDGKAKVNSSNLRRLMTPLRESGSILLILNQTRDSFDQFTAKTRSGGRALGFYAQVEVWSSIKERLKRTVNKKKRQYGIVSKMDVKRSRVTGKERTAFVPILNSSGIDEYGSLVDFLVDEGVWKKARGKQSLLVDNAFSMKEVTRGKLIKMAEEDPDVAETMRDLVLETWDGIEEALKPLRKKRYG